MRPDPLKARARIVDAIIGVIDRRRARRRARPEPRPVAPAMRFERDPSSGNLRIARDDR
jgi:hypothetical protein